MKFNKKKIFTLALAVCMIAILSFSTLAWFNDKDMVTNKFHVATSSDDPDDIFSIDVMERIDVDGDGVVDATVDVEDDDVNTVADYEDIYPSAELVKEPIVVNRGAYDQYVRVNVTIDKEWDTLIGGDLTATLKGYDATVWTEDTNKVEANGKVTYTYYLNRVLVAGDAANTGRETLFTHVIIPETLDQDDFATLNNGQFAMEIVAEAVQADNTGATAQAAFALVNP